MKRIAKGPEPRAFSEWKQCANENWTPTFKTLSKEAKQSIYSALLEEQGHLCCYCCKRIEADDCHIEHLKPQTAFEAEALNYDNMLASCMKERSKKFPMRCGVLKDNWYDQDLLISPLNPNCEDRFKYTADGQIHPSNQDQAPATTITKLGLNIDRVARLRKAVFDGLFEDLLELSQMDKSKLLSHFANRSGTTGKYAEFSPAICYFLKQY
jgi:uncharacterized protein (TIGR02646 family)